MGKMKPNAVLKTMKTPSQIAELDLLGILNEVFCGKFSQDRQPQKEVKPDEIARAKVGSPLGARLYAAFNILRDEAIAITGKHKSAHEDAAKCEHTPLDCAAYASQMEVFKDRFDVLQKLFWLVVTEEHPAVATSHVTLRKDMILASKFGEDWEDVVAPDPSDSIIKTLSGRLEAIMRGSAEAQDAHAPDDAVGEGETVLGTVEDQRIRSVWKLRGLLVDEMNGRKPADLDPDNNDSIREWLGSHTLDEAEAVVALGKRYHKAIEALESVVWTAIRDSLKGGHDHDGIGLRKDWQVVSLPAEPDDEGIKVHNLDGVMVVDISLGTNRLPKDMPPELAAVLSRVINKAREE